MGELSDAWRRLKYRPMCCCSGVSWIVEKDMEMTYLIWDIEEIAEKRKTLRCWGEGRVAPAIARVEDYLPEENQYGQDGESDGLIDHGCCEWRKTTVVVRGDLVPIMPDGIAFHRTPQDPYKRLTPITIVENLLGWSASLTAIPLIAIFSASPDPYCIRNLCTKLSLLTDSSQSVVVFLQSSQPRKRPPTPQEDDRCSAFQLSRKRGSPEGRAIL